MSSDTTIPDIPPRARTARRIAGRSASTRPRSPGTRPPRSSDPAVAERRGRVAAAAAELAAQGVPPTRSAVAEALGIDHTIANSDLVALRRSGMLPPWVPPPRPPRRPRARAASPPKPRPKPLPPRLTHARAYLRRTASARLRYRWTAEDDAIRSAWRASLPAGALWLVMDAPTPPLLSPRGAGWEPDDDDDD
jgi:hypothetical protein